MLASALKFGSKSRLVPSIYGIEKETLVQLGRGQDTLPRDLAMYLMRQYRMDSLQTISGYSGNIYYSTVSNSITRASQKIETNIKYHQILKDVKETV
jgi:chromosomal replication initiation ATPase DnaA